MTILEEHIPKTVNGNNECLPEITNPDDIYQYYVRFEIASILCIAEYMDPDLYKKYINHTKNSIMNRDEFYNFLSKLTAKQLQFDIGKWRAGFDAWLKSITE